MALVWLPGIWIDGTSMWWPLPGPISRLAVRETTETAAEKVPGTDGALHEVPSLGVVEISVTGTIQRSGAGVLLATEAQVEAELQNLKTYSRGAATTHEFWFVLYYDAGTSTYRYYKECLRRDLSTNMEQGDTVGVPYALSVVAYDPTYQTAQSGNLA